MRWAIADLHPRPHIGLIIENVPENTQWSAVRDCIWRRGYAVTDLRHRAKVPLLAPWAECLAQLTEWLLDDATTAVDIVQWHPDSTPCSDRRLYRGT